MLNKNEFENAIKGKIILLDKTSKDEFKDILAKDIASSCDPRYYSLISMMVNENYVQFMISGEGGYCKPCCTGNKVLNVININNCHLDGEVVFHELGHAMDAFVKDVNKGKLGYYSLESINGSSSLDSILNEELKANGDILYKNILKDVSNFIDSQYGEGTFDIYSKNLPLFKEYESVSKKLGGLPSALMGYKYPTFVKAKNLKLQERFNELFDLNVKYGLTSIKNRINDSKLREIMEEKYSSPVLEVIGAHYDLQSYGLEEHYNSYYKDAIHNDTIEFFADLSSYFFSNDEAKQAKSNKYLPRAFAKAKVLFDQRVEEILNN